MMLIFALVRSSSQGNRHINASIQDHLSYDQLCQLKRQLEQANAEKEQLMRQFQQTTLSEYLRDNHVYLFKNLQIAKK